jgi:hypothetical protein
MFAFFTSLSISGAIGVFGGGGTDRCTLKLQYLGPNNWIPSCSGTCASGAMCQLPDPPIVDAQGNTTYKCLCGSLKPVVPCDGVFITDTGQQWIIIQCWNDTCTTECDILGGYGVDPIPACRCPT